MELKTKYATKNDLAELSILFVEIVESLKYYNDTAKKDELAKYTSSELEKKIAEDELSIIIVRNDSELVGFCFSRFDDYTIWLEWFGIADKYRGNKIGDIILNELEKSTLKRGCHKIWCDSRTENISSLKVLLKNGYNLITTLKNHWYNQDFFIWQKQLTP